MNFKSIPSSDFIKVKITHKEADKKIEKDIEIIKKNYFGTLES